MKRTILVCVAALMIAATSFGQSGIDIAAGASVGAGASSNTVTHFLVCDPVTLVCQFNIPSLKMSGATACLQVHDATASAVDGFVSSNGAFITLQANRNPCTGAIIDSSKASGLIAIKTAVNDSHIELYSGTTNNAAGTLNGFIAATGPALFNGSVALVAADFTTAANTSLQTFATLTLPALTAANYPFRCEGMYSQATAAVADQFGVQAATFAPTNIAAKADVDISASTFTAANLPILAATTATAIVTFTPSAITTVWNFRITGMIENPSNASTQVVNFMVQTSTAGDAVTVKRGSYCMVGF